MISKKIFQSFFIILFSSLSIYAQEICNDGIDNDGDGLVDLNDPDCDCSGTAPTILEAGDMCTNDLVLTLSSVGSGTYQWYFEGVAIAGENTSSLDINALMGTVGNYQATYIESAACEQASLNVVLNTATVTVSSNEGICEGDVINISASGANTYNWDNGLLFGDNHDVSPLVSTTYSVIATNINGCTATDQVIITVHPNPVPTITGGTFICLGLTIPLDAGSGYTMYEWSNSINTQVSNYGLPGVAIVTVTDVNSCSGIDSVDLLMSPTIIPNVNSSSDFVCVGDQIDLSVTGAGPGGFYLWDNPLGMGQVHNDVTITATTDFFVTLTDVNNCEEIASIGITSIDVPVMDVNPKPDTVICKGSSAILRASGATTYAWFPSYGLSDATGEIVVATPDVTTSYSVTGSNSIGGTTCSSTIYTEVIIDNFDINLPLNETFCKDEKPTIMAIVSNGTPPYTYSWTINNTIRQDIGATIVDTIVGIRNYQVVGVDYYGCSSTANATYQSYPDLVFDPYTNFDTVCPGDPVQFNASISGGTGEPYHFIFDGSYSNTILTLFPKNTYNFRMSVKDGCEEIKDSILIVTHEIPYLDFIASEYGGCSPKEVQFTSTSIPSDLIASYVWNFGDNDANNLSVSESPLHIYKQQGAHSVKLEVLTEDGCFTDTTKLDYIQIQPKPNVSFVAEPTTVSILDPVIYFRNTSINLDSLSFIWNFGVGKLSNLVNPEYTFNSIGNYEIELIGSTSFGCTDTTYRLVEVKPEVKFYIPNGFSPDGDGINEVFLPVGTNILTNGYRFTVYSRDGLTVFDTEQLDEGWNGQSSSGAYCKTGIYVYTINFKDIYGISYTRDGIINLLR